MNFFNQDIGTWEKHNDYFDVKNTNRNMGNMNKNKILLLDDDYHGLLTLKRLLKECGYLVNIFKDPEEALNHFIMNPMSYDIVISDLHNSFIATYDVLKRMRKINPEITILVTTTSKFEAFIDERESLFKRSSYLHVDGIISKPLPKYELCKIVKNNSYT